MTITSIRLQELRKARGYSQQDVASLIGVGRTTYLKYENGDNRPTRKLNELARLFNVSTDYLLGLTDTPTESLTQPLSQSLSKERGVRIPVLGRVVAGIPIEAIEEVIDWEEIPQKMAATGKFFALRVCGHSMEPTILEGDVVIVRQQEDVDSGDIAIVLVNGDEATVKRVKKQKDGITLIATNTSVYEPHFYSNQEIHDLPVRVVGKVEELRRKM
ncbi:LexA family transcriptional regulator [uncultured Mitsuokella sp.]|uniref:LexA family protein n=1 Tax=uncultured Mitsuokella sp. TaxID=453120 RepID=UPI00266EC712|nr:LexA family transcriptional regulator [uncultured Mitsuokella sp.]